MLIVGDCVCGQTAQQTAEGKAAGKQRLNLVLIEIGGAFGALDLNGSGVGLHGNGFAGAADHERKGAGGAPLAELGALLGSDAVRQAADALAHSGIDANAVANMLKGADLGKLDPAKLDPAALLGGKIALVAPDGSRHEINLGDLMRSNGNIGELLKGLDLGKSDPAALLGSKIFLIGPDGRQTEIDLAPMLKSAGAIGGLLKGFGPPPGH